MAGPRLTKWRGCWSARPLQIVTNSLPVANLFASNANTDLVLLGGYIYPRTGVSLGPYANEMLSHLNVRKTVLSVAGINDRGFYNSNLLLVETERAMMRAADEVIVVADSTKFGRQSLAHCRRWAMRSTWSSMMGSAQEWQAKAKQAGVKLLVATLGKNNEQ